MPRQVAIRIEPLHVADFVHPEGSLLAGRTGIVMAFAVVHPDGVVVFDTGIGVGDEEIEAAYRPTVRALPELLRAAGIELDDVVAAANSHLHFDHCGQNGALPGIPIHVQAAELAAAHEPDYTIPSWVDAAGTRYVQHDGDAELLPCVRLLPTPGHTPGHQSLVVDAEDGRTVIVGQALYTKAEWTGASEPGQSGQDSAWDPAAYRASVARLRALAPDRVLFGHER
jgi:glyoxylase-like metal-dependent hydrolase (beta-lactamase superfamily II)